MPDLKAMLDYIRRTQPSGSPLGSGVERPDVMSPAEHSPSLSAVLARRKPSTDDYAALAPLPSADDYAALAPVPSADDYAKLAPVPSPGERATQDQGAESMNDDDARAYILGRLVMNDPRIAKALLRQFELDRVAGRKNAREIMPPDVMEKAGPMLDRAAEESMREWGMSGQ